MRVAVPVLALLNSLVAAGNLYLFVWSVNNGPFIRVPPWMYLTLGAVGVLVVVATVTVGLVAMIQRRQWAWLSGLVVAGLFGVTGSIVALVRALMTPYITYWDPPCSDPSQCPPPTLAYLSGLEGLFLATPLLVGLVMVLYSFNMREYARRRKPSSA